MSAEEKQTAALRADDEKEGITLEEKHRLVMKMRQLRKLLRLRGESLDEVLDQAIAHYEALAK